MADEKKVDLSKLDNVMCYCFGCDFLKPDGTIDYNELKKELEEIQYFYAAMMFSAGDVENIMARLMPYPTGKWIFEQDEVDLTEEDFAAFVKTKEFRKFSKPLAEKIEKAISTLQLVDKTELDKNNVDKTKIDKIVNAHKNIVNTVKKAVATPTMKKLY